MTWYLFLMAAKNIVIYLMGVATGILFFTVLFKGREGKSRWLMLGVLVILFLISMGLGLNIQLP